MQQWSIQHNDFGAKSIFYFEAGPIVHYKRVISDQVLVILPPVNVLKTVCTHDNGELLERELFREVSERIYCVLRLWECKLYVTGTEFRVVFNGNIDQVKAVVFIK